MAVWRRTRWLCPAAALALVLAPTLAGCRQDHRSYVTQERLEAGLVVSLDGVGGYNWGPKWLRSGLQEAGLKAAIVIYDWSQGPQGLFVGDLVAEDRNHAAAKDLAQMVTTYSAALPGRPITLIGHSGGAAVVVWALESLPEGCRIERVFLLAPALSPEYDLSRALKHVDRRMYVMYSYADVGLMAAGTAVFGTMDRQHGVSAGLVGFRLPPALPAAQQAEYLKVRQIPWTIDLVKMGNLGDHMGWTTTRFARDFIAPILAGRTDPGEPLAVPAGPATATAPPADDPPPLLRDAPPARDAPPPATPFHATGGPTP
jgi:pimeloyl-ACP methyl ester carboxylesterase